MKKIYENKLYKVVYMDFGCGFGKLYAVFSNNETEFNRSTMISARKKRYNAMHEADYLQSLAELKKPKCKYNKDGICVNADSEILADYCFLNNDIGCLMEELKTPSRVCMIEFFIKHNAKVREEMAVEILRKAKEIEKDFDKTGLYEYIVANFLKGNKNG